MISGFVSSLLLISYSTTEMEAWRETVRSIFLLSYFRNWKLIVIFHQLSPLYGKQKDLSLNMECTTTLNRGAS